jgi:peptidoglycan/xylan/chitin deacetylase (PgdA/CDA1 family)
LGVKRRKKIPVAIALFLLAMTVLAILTTSTSFMVKAEVPPHGVISIAFDDNYQNQYDYAFPLMQARAIVGTFYVVTNHISDFSRDPSYMSTAELQTLQANGNEIGSHSETHYDFITLTDAQIREECGGSKTLLESYNLTVTDFAYPDGLTNDHIDSIVSQYYRSGRTAYVEPYLMDAPTSQFSVSGFSAETADYSALSLLKGMVDEVSSTNGWAIIFFHNIKPDAYTEQYTTSTQDFADFLDYIIFKGVETLTVNQVLNLTPLSMTTNLGTITPTSGLYALGSTLNIAAFAPSAATGERYIWNGWTGTGNGSYSGLNSSPTITINGPITENASWSHEYKLTVLTNSGNTTPTVGEYWCRAGTSVNVETSSPPPETGVQYLYSGWSGTGSVPASGSFTALNFTMNGPSSITWTWNKQYYLTVSSAYGSTGGEGWYDAGSSAYANISSTTILGPSGTQYLFVGWSGDASGSSSHSEVIVMNNPKTATATWSLLPTSTPTNTPTSTPTNTPKPTSTPTATPTPAPTASISPFPSYSPTVSPSPNSDFNNTAVYTFIVVGVMLASVTISVIALFKRKKN